MRKPKPRRGRLNEYLTIDEFCALFRISRKASWHQHRPFLKTVVFGGRTLIPRDEAKRYAESLSRPPRSALRATPRAAS